MKKWLSDAERQLLEQWINGTTHPMAATLPDGTVLYANKSWQRIIGCTDIEYDEGVKWTEITINNSDLKLDSALAEETKQGQRESYQFSKTYRHKEHFPVSGFVFVQRFPLHGGEEEFECFLVSFHPSDNSSFSVIEEINKINETNYALFKSQIDTNDKISESLKLVQDTVNTVKILSEKQLNKKNFIDLLYSLGYNIKEFTISNKKFMYPFWGLLITLILHKYFGLDLITPLQDMGILPQKSYSVEDIEAIKIFLEKKNEAH